MAKIFDVFDWLNNHPNRNNFDLTHKVHGSYKMGVIYPFLCKPVVPTDSFQIDTAVSARFMPMPFPPQSNVRFVFHYFYVRAKNIWKNFPNWLEGLEEHTPPYLNLPHDFYKNGSLADFLDVPTSYSVPPKFTPQLTSVPFDKTGLPYPASSRLYYLLYGIGSQVRPSNSEFVSFGDVYRTAVLNGFGYFGVQLRNIQTQLSFSMSEFPSDIILKELEFMSDYYDSVPSSCLLVVAKGDYIYGVCSYSFTYDFNHAFYYNRSSLFNRGDNYIDPDVPSDASVYIFFRGVSEQIADTPIVSFNSAYFDVYYKPKSFEVGAVSNVSKCPYFCSDSLHDDTNLIKVSSLPFRAYESIYRAFYANQQGVQPFTINGVVQYNKYVTNDGDGADDTNYELFRRNWELDAYTSALLTAQQNSVPYVGLSRVSALGEMSVETPEGDTASVRLSDNGNGVEIENLRGETPESRRLALDRASLGFTIPEFREANALQRFLELNIRKGYRYIDFIAGHFGKSPKYAEMDMPEFLGGFVQRVSINEISNTNGVDNNQLGAIAGQMRAIGGSNHGISHYFDDFGFIVGCMCIVPDTAYDCILPKHFNLKHPLDMYFPEFSQLSMQPITYEEFCPIQSKVDNRPLTDTFGYQRPNHDLVWYPDTVHGNFRDPSTGFGDSVICRRFSSRPELSAEFLRINPQDTDTIFSYTLGDEDVCLGEIVMDIKAKRPVPRLVVPTIS